MGVEHDRFHRDSTALATPAVLKVGLAPRLQLEVASTAVRTSAAGVTRAAMGDLSAALKWRLGDSLPILRSVAIEPSLKLPTGSVARGTGTGTVDEGLL